MKKKSNNYFEPGFYPIQIGLNGFTGTAYCPTCWRDIKETDTKCPHCKQPLTNRFKSNKN